MTLFISTACLYVDEQENIKTYYGKKNKNKFSSNISEKHAALEAKVHSRKFSVNTAVSADLQGRVGVLNPGVQLSTNLDWNLINLYSDSDILDPEIFQRSLEFASCVM